MRRVCRRYDIQTVFQLASILCRQLTRVKDQDPLEKKLGVAYQIPCSCVYVRQTKRTLKTHVKEQKAATRWGETEKSVTAEYTWGQYQPILWEETRVLDQAKNNTLLIKETLHICLTNFRLINTCRWRRCHSKMLATGPRLRHDDELYPHHATPGNWWWNNRRYLACYISVN